MGSVGSGMLISRKDCLIRVPPEGVGSSSKVHSVESGGTPPCVR